MGQSTNVIAKILGSSANGTQHILGTLQMGLQIYWALNKWDCKYIGHFTNGIANILGSLPMILQIRWAVSVEEPPPGQPANV